ncbi:hypothetical protein [Geomonas sp.]|uniref:hypothetical protein n=1 Tax=Geomonas sp. TaxID=2651584 RepID=UPI002B4A6CE9|nr:hypothetical protein [Geomonas sp.]
MSAASVPRILRRFGGVIASCSLLVGTAAAAQAATEGVNVWGESNTVLRFQSNTEDDRIWPLYEYLHVGASTPCPNGVCSFAAGGWGRLDLADNTTNQDTNGDLQYGFLKYQANKSNTQFTLGRQTVSEGVASDNLQGLYMRSDFLYGFTGSAYIGQPVTTEPNYKGGSLIYGGRIAHFVPNLYAIGFSYVRSTQYDQNLREQEGIDLWLHPLPMVDITGRSTYNSLTNGWAENAYTLSVTPLDWVRASFNLQQLNYRDYFSQVTTSALSLVPNGPLDPNESVVSVGGTLGCTLVKNLKLSADAKHYNYEKEGDANYFGGGIVYSHPDYVTAGFNYHRMNGASQRFKYDQYFAYVSKEIGPADFTISFFDVDYDNGIYSNGVKNTFAVTWAAGYAFTKSLKVAADVDFFRSSEFVNGVEGLIKLTYAFGSKGGQSEK